MRKKQYFPLLTTPSTERIDLHIYNIHDLLADQNIAKSVGQNSESKPSDIPDPKQDKFIIPLPISNKSIQPLNQGSQVLPILPTTTQCDQSIIIGQQIIDANVTSKSSNSNNMLMKTKWTYDEDQLLIQTISKYGSKNWSLIASEIPGRTGKQCRERWLNQLNPELNKEHWSNNEDLILIRFQYIYGNCWSKIATYLPGRSSNAVKNRWGFIMRHHPMMIELMHTGFK